MHYSNFETKENESRIFSRNMKNITQTFFSIYLAGTDLQVEMNVTARVFEEDEQDYTRFLEP